MSAGPLVPLPAPAPPLVPLAADPAALEGAIRDVAPALHTPLPGPAAYVRDVFVAVASAVSDLFEQVSPAFARFFGMAAQVLAALLLTGVAAALVVALLRRIRARRTAAPSVPLVVAPLPEPRDADAAPWAARVEERLAAGDVAGALAALWWWLACRLAGADVEASWTSRELVSRSGRRELLPAVRRLDRLRYGGAVPGAAEVRVLFGELRGRLEPATEAG